MKKSDIAILVGLVLLLPVWWVLSQKFLPPPPAPAAAALAADGTNTAPGAATNLPSGAGTATVATALVPEPPAAPATPPILQAAPPEPAAAGAGPELPPERKIDLTNATALVTLSSRGGGVTAVLLKRYPLTRARGSPPVVLDFSAAPALSYDGLPGIDTNSDFSLALAPGGRQATLDADLANGVHLVRTIILTNRYVLTVEDVFTNRSAAGVTFPEHGLRTGPMGMMAGESAMKGMAYLGIDTLRSTGGEGVRYWASKRFFSHDLALADFFQEESRRGGGCSMNRVPMTHPLPLAIREPVRQDTDWVAVKNKFFVQILTPQGGAQGCDLLAERLASPRERPEDSRSWDGAATLDKVAAELRFAARTLGPGEALRRVASYYVGPTEYSAIHPLGNHKDEVMQFGWLAPLCVALLWTLNCLYWLIPNYGVAIILLTVLTRVIFWPLTHKGTESMKRMQALQPQMLELRAKYKDKPQKLQQETMALYKANKVNPLGGCLPMVIQIPVFIALFNVLRSAVELRYAGFLWIGDLSAPENLLEGMIPIAGSLNILPIFMAATQAWQTKLTPSGGDPAQQKMMMFMPLIMLVFFYTMPSALILYWSANQVMMIVQLLWQRQRSHAHPAKG